MRSWEGSEVVHYLPADEVASGFVGASRRHETPGSEQKISLFVVGGSVSFVFMVVVYAPFLWVMVRGSISKTC